jgi:putative hydrolase of the HAD superfamily
VVSNANGRIHATMERVGLSRHFDLVLDSHLEGVEKPDPRLFALALERSGATAATTLHVGDFHCIDVVGARAAGLQAALLDPLGLHPDADCLRVRSMGDLADRLGAAQPGEQV